MQRDRFEWLRAEQARTAVEGTGASYVRYQLKRHYLRCAGFFGVMVPLVLVISVLPRQPDGPTKPLPLLVLGVCALVAGTISLRSRVKSSLVGWWAGWTAVAVGVFAILMSAVL